MNEPVCKMGYKERRQLYDEIQAGEVNISDLSTAKLRDFRCDFDIDYAPDEYFFRIIGIEIRRRAEVKRKTKKIVKDFFG